MAGSPATAATIMLDFAEEPLAVYAGHGAHVGECGCIVRSEADGGYLVVSDFYLGSRAIVVGEEAGALRLDLLAPVTALSLDFGGDEAGAADGPAQHAPLRLPARS